MGRADSQENKEKEKAQALISCWRTGIFGPCQLVLQNHEWRMVIITDALLKSILLLPNDYAAAAQRVWCRTSESFVSEYLK